MKKYLLSIIALSSLLLVSCEKESEGLARITYYPILTVNGGDAAINIGDTYTDAGCTATLNGVDISDQVQSTNNINNAVLGAYNVNYIVFNEDGFSASASRNVYVTNGTNFDNIYLSACRYGSRSYTNLPIKIADNGDGTYTIEDILGGFYALGRYPTYLGRLDFFADAVIQLNGDNTITLISVGNWYWSSDPTAAISITTGTYDPATATITLNIDFGGDPFYVQLVVPGNN